MYERLTAFIPSLQTDNSGEWVFDTENDGTLEHPMHLPYVNYGNTVRKLMDEIYLFQKKHPEFGLDNYSDILQRNGLEWGAESMRRADVTALDGKAIMAVLLGTVRAERFCDGALLSFCKDGSIIKWLERLKVLDEN